MAFSYDPNASNCLPAGEYHATLLKVTDAPSKRSGQDMLTLLFKAYGPGGKDVLVNEYVTANNSYKLKGLAKAFGKEADYQAGTFDAEQYVKQDLRLSLTVEEDEDYGDKNRIAKYLPAEDAAAAAPAQSARPAARPTQQRQPVAAGAIPETGGIPAEDIPF